MPQEPAFSAAPAQIVFSWSALWLHETPLTGKLLGLLGMKLSHCLQRGDKGTASFSPQKGSQC